jgi:hypothetical protein
LKHPKKRAPARPVEELLDMDRGEYRPFYQALWAGKDWQALTPEARLTWAALKGNCGAIGIRAVPGLLGALAEWTGYPFETLSHSLADLSATDWIEVEGSVVWVKRGLDFEPSLNPANPNHVKFVLRSVKSLPRRDIVRRFCDYYAPRWHGIREAFEGVSKASAITTPSPTPILSSGAAGRSSGPEMTELLSQIRGEHDRMSIALWIDECPNPAAWARTFSRWLAGTDQPCTVAALARMCREWELVEAKVYKPRFVEACVRSAAAAIQRGEAPGVGKGWTLAFLAELERDETGPGGNIAA